MGGDEIMRCGRVWVLPSRHGHARRKPTPFTKNCGWGVVWDLYNNATFPASPHLSALLSFSLLPIPQLFPGRGDRGPKLTVLLVALSL